MTGRRNRPESELVAAVSDGFMPPIRVLRYVRCPCADCLHAVDFKPDREVLTESGRSVGQWIICDAGLWRSPCSLWGLVNHRVPVVQPGPCPGFERRSEGRPAVLAMREADRTRLSRLRRRRRDACSDGEVGARVLI